MGRHSFYIRTVYLTDENKGPPLGETIETKIVESRITRIEVAYHCYNHGTGGVRGELEGRHTRGNPKSNERGLGSCLFSSRRSSARSRSFLTSSSSFGFSIFCTLRLKVNFTVFLRLRQKNKSPTRSTKPAILPITLPAIVPGWVVLGPNSSGFGRALSDAAWLGVDEIRLSVLVVPGAVLVEVVCVIGTGRVGRGLEWVEELERVGNASDTLEPESL